MIPGLVGSKGTTDTSGNDTIIGTWTESGATGGTFGGTLNLGDKLDAGAGTNTLEVTVGNTVTGPAATTVLTGFTANKVQKVFVTATGTAAGNTTTLDASTTPDATEFWSSGSTKGVIFGPAFTAGTAIQQNATIGLKNTLQNVNATFKDSIVQGTSDTGTVALGGGVGDTTAQPTVDLDGVTATNGFETINIVSSGTAANRLAALQTGTNVLEKVNISGTSSVRIDNVNSTAFDTLNASGLTGSASANISAATSAQTDLKFTGSANGDRVILNNVTANAANTFSLNGGDGTDTIAVGTLTAFNAAGQQSLRDTVNKATSFEVFEATAIGVTALQANQFTGINAFKFSGANAVNLALTGVETADSFEFSANHVGAAGTGSGTAGTQGLTFTGAAPGQTASLILGNSDATVAITGGAANVADTAAAAIGFGGAVSTLKIESKGGVANTITGGADDGTSGAGVAAVAIDNGVSVQSVVITGTQDLTIAGGGNGGGSGTAQINAFSNSVSVNASGFSGALTIGGSTQADSFTAGTGKATFNASQGADTYALGAAADKVVYTNVNQSLTDVTDDTGILNTIDKVSSWSTSDKLNVATVTGATGGGWTSAEFVAQNVVQAAVDAVGPTTLLQAAQAAAANLGADKIGAFQYGGNTYILGQDNAAAFAGTDLFVQISGAQTLTADNFVLA